MRNQSWPWCVLTFDNRPVSLRYFWTRSAHINERYARIHGYGYRHTQLTDSACLHAAQGVRAPAWCKLPVIAEALLDGIDGRACSRLWYVDSDAIVAEPALSLDAHLARARAAEDEALVDEAWEVLFASNYWFDDGPNTGVMWVNGSRAACGILRVWWDAKFPHHQVRRPWEQAALAAMHAETRPFGKRARMLVTARFFRAEDAEWTLVGGRPPPPVVRSSRRDGFVHHGLKGGREAQRAYAAALANITTVATRIKPAASLEAPSASRQHRNASTLARIFAKAAARCPFAKPREGAPPGFDRHREGRPKLRPSRTNLDGTPSASPRRCWKVMRWSAEDEPSSRPAEEWVC